MHTVFLDPVSLAYRPKGLIFTSETGVAAFVRLHDRPDAPVWCVGRRTENAAKKAGLVPVFTAPHAAGLLAHMLSVRPEGPFLHVRGEDSHGDIAQSLTNAGIPTDEAIVYGQRAQPLAPRALGLLHGQRPVVVPLFSARSAALFHAAAPTAARCCFAALSPAVAAAISPAAASRIVVSHRPDADAMLQTVMSLLREP